MKAGINDHILCYGHPWHPRCQRCARNITDKINDVDYSVFNILSSAPLDLKRNECEQFTKRLHKNEKIQKGKVRRR